MLEGPEAQGKIGDVGEYVVDVDSKGKVVVSAGVAKDLQHSKLKISAVLELDIFKLLEELAKKTETQLDDKALATIKLLLGIKDEAPAAPAEPNPVSSV